MILAPIVVKEYHSIYRVTFENGKLIADHEVMRNTIFSQRLNDYETNVSKWLLPADETLFFVEFFDKDERKDENVHSKVFAYNKETNCYESIGMSFKQFKKEYQNTIYRDRILNTQNDNLYIENLQDYDYDLFVKYDNKIFTPGFFDKKDNYFQCFVTVIKNNEFILEKFNMNNVISRMVHFCNKRIYVILPQRIPFVVKCKDKYIYARKNGEEWKGENVIARLKEMAIPYEEYISFELASKTIELIPHSQQ